MLKFAKSISMVFIDLYRNDTDLYTHSYVIHVVIKVTCDKLCYHHALSENVYLEVFIQYFNTHNFINLLVQISTNAVDTTTLPGLLVILLAVTNLCLVE